MSCATEGLAAFFTILDNASASQNPDSWLPLPPFFMQLHGAQLAREVTIYGPDDVSWCSEIRGQSLGTLGLRNGWNSVVAAYGLRAGDLVVMRLVKDSTFKAEMFGGRSQVAKHPKAITQQVQVQVSRSSYDMRTEMRKKSNGQTATQVGYHHGNVAKDRSAKTKSADQHHPAPNEPRKRGRPRKAPSELPAQKQQKTSNPNPRRRNLLQIANREWDSPAMKMARQFTSDKPCYTVAMKDSHALRVFYMGISIEFARQFLPAEATKMVLLDNSGRRWPARWLGDRRPCGISAGWRGFARHHNIEVDDVCVFELVDSNRNEPVLKIHIFKAAREQEWRSNGMDMVVADSEDGF